MGTLIPARILPARPPTPTPTSTSSADSVLGLDDFLKVTELVLATARDLGKPLGIEAQIAGVRAVILPHEQMSVTLQMSRPAPQKRTPQPLLPDMNHGFTELPPIPTLFGEGVQLHYETDVKPSPESLKSLVKVQIAVAEAAAAARSTTSASLPGSSSPPTTFEEQVDTVLRTAPPGTLSIEDVLQLLPRKRTHDDAFPHEKDQAPAVLPAPQRSSSSVYHA